MYDNNKAKANKPNHNEPTLVCLLNSALAVSMIDDFPASF